MIPRAPVASGRSSSVSRWRLASLARERAGRRTRTLRQSASMRADAAPAIPSRCPTSRSSDIAEALERVAALGGSVVHPGEVWAICKDSEGSPFGLAQEAPGGVGRTCAHARDHARLPASRAVVFAAFSDADQLATWWGPKGFTIPSLEFEPRGGATYRIEMQPPEGDGFYLTGEFRAVDPPARLAFSFRWEEPDPDDVETEVELSFHAARRIDGGRARPGPVQDRAAACASPRRLDGLVRQARAARLAHVAVRWFRCRAPRPLEDFAPWELSSFVGV